MMLIIVGVVAISCVDGQLDGDIKKDVHQVRIRLGNEYSRSLQISDVDGEASAYVGIQVYAGMGYGRERKYAYGIFSQTEAISIQLEEGYEYRMECVAVESGDDEVYATANENGLTEMGRFPFSGKVVTNQFYYGVEVFRLSKRFVSVRNEIGDEVVVENGDVRMYYGCVDNYRYDGNEFIEIPMIQIGKGIRISFDLESEELETETEELYFYAEEWGEEEMGVTL